MISSKAGTTLPDALTLTSIVPRVTSEKTRLPSFTLLRIHEKSRIHTTTHPTPIPPYCMSLLLRNLFRTSFDISLSIFLSIIALFLKQHPCQKDKQLISNNNPSSEGVRYRTPCSVLNTDHPFFARNLPEPLHISGTLPTFKFRKEKNDERAGNTKTKDTDGIRQI